MLNPDQIETWFDRFEEVPEKYPWVRQDSTIHRYCASSEEAEALQAFVGSLCGSRLERDDDFIYASFSVDSYPEPPEEHVEWAIEQMDQAVTELESSGFDVEEVG